MDLEKQNNKYYYELDAQAIRGFIILLDVDGTLGCDKQRKVSKEVRSKTRKLSAHNTIYLCSNARDKLRIHNLSVELNVNKLPAGYRKPSKKILSIINGAEDRSVLVIGDRYYPDRVLSFRIGAEFIKARRMLCPGDRWFVKLSYWLDDLGGKFIGLLTGR